MVNDIGRDRREIMQISACFFLSFTSKEEMELNKIRDARLSHTKIGVRNW